MAIITISRLTGSGGREIATATAEALNFQLIDRRFVVLVTRGFYAGKPRDSVLGLVRRDLNLPDQREHVGI